MRKFYIGNNDKERICARLTDGVLEIFIPKIENNANLSRKISINQVYFNRGMMSLTEFSI